MRALVLICIVFSLWSCKGELVGECSSPFKITVKESKIIDSKEVYSIEINKNSSWWVNSITVNGKELDLDRTVITTNNFVYDSELFILERISDQAMKITIKDNFSEPKLVVGVQSGNCFSGFTID
ncbi:hypothetical protein [Sphingobacterium bovistauri]|uniref:Binding domain-containing protein, N-terminal n=1 Tax=Sphingobacterium bovistauri TaxID=2781959 RepID=A0ABS7Z3J6_9SPHI|nr:hypothetical protein [Sphingobacterium bovistauri]MCA5004756.1 hypothetical protein [Sphingobacterium bovistauri]